MITQIKNLHIIRKDKFDEAFIKFINKNFVKEENLFIVIANREKYQNEYINENNVIVYFQKEHKLNLFKMFESIKRNRFIYKYAKECDKIFWHQIEKRFILFLFIFRGILKKSYWIIWGGDLYSHLNRKKSLRYKLRYKIEDYVKGNFKGYITHIEGDYKLAQKWYGAKGKYYNCFMYPSNLYKKIELKNIEKKVIYIQIGNSATDSNNHFEILKKLEKYKNNDIKLFCILSYGNNNDKIKKIIEVGKNIFGDKFIPIVDFMKFDEYMEFLSKIDIAIFAHNRQQAVGNITSLLSMKKTVYLKEGVTTYGMLEDSGVKVKSFDKFENLEKFDDEILEKNKEIIKERFSEKRLVEDWKKIFEDDINVKN